ncbi:MAG TPA: hypothetical protein ENJ82_00230, partial [Bacteroidetes bacterium]|nr:hypothetical protein [Bacteroidota bacterium]
MLRQFIFVIALLSGSVLLPNNSVSTDTGEQGDTLRFLFFGHAYDWQSDGSQVDPRISGLNLEKYSRIFMGGDICSEAMLRYSTLARLDSIFDLGNPNTHYVLGNHDARNENEEWYEAICERKTYSTHSVDGITVVVL